MSTRFYPRFVRGNPQLRIFLPDWKMVMIKEKKPLPENIVSFKVDPRMTDWDIKNYLEKIYKVKVATVNSKIFPGKLEPVPQGITKMDDYRIAHVTLSVGQKFTWPDLFPSQKSKEEKEDIDRTINQIKKGGEKDPNVQDIPSWFI